MRDEVDSLARELQRSKPSKGERITANTVVRVAIRCLLDHFKSETSRSVNSEEELFELVNE